MKDIPRLEMEQLDPRLTEALQPRVKRLGYLGEFFKCAGHQPDALLGFMQFTEALKDALPDRLTETVALTVASSLRNLYERNQHERLSEKLGFPREWIYAVCLLNPDQAPHMTDDERAVQRLSLAVLEAGGLGSKPLLEEVVERIGHKQAMGALLLIGRYAAHAMYVNTLELAPPVASIFGGRQA